MRCRLGSYTPARSRELRGLQAWLPEVTRETWRLSNPIASRIEERLAPGRAPIGCDLKFRQIDQRPSRRTRIPTRCLKPVD